MANFFAELKRRHIYRVGAAYVVVAWVLAQVVDLLSQIFELPGSIARPAVILLVVGFPVALITAWMIESKPHAAVASAVKAKPTAVDWTLLGALAVVLLFMGYRQLVPMSGMTPQAGVEAARSAATSPSGVISLAVLPFSNLSSDPEQQFFSDGMTEEITAALAKIPDLRVIARTSAFQFREQNRDIQSISQALNASHFIEGSVRTAGTRVRITAQLIEARSGVHVWAQNYDRELADVFAVQEEIATSIAGALNMQLGLAPGQQLVSNRAIDPESYQQFLRAKAVLLGPNSAFPDALAILEPLVARNPNYAPAWERLALAYARAVAASNVGPGEAARTMRETYQPKMEAAARRAIELDPNYPPAIIWQAYLQTGPKQWLLFEDAVQKALRLDGDNPDALNFYGSMLMMLGRVNQAIAVQKQLLELEPFVPLYFGNLADALWLDGQDEAAIAIYNNYINNPGAAGAGAPRALAQLYAAQGRFQMAADVLTQRPANLAPQAHAELVRLLRSGPTKFSSPETLPDLARFNWVYLYVGGQSEPVLKYYEETVRGQGDIALLWHSSYASVRKTERFKNILRKANVVDYWRERGWPPLCHPTTGDDFACE